MASSSPTPAPAHRDDARARLLKCMNALRAVVRIPDPSLELVLASIVARGHVLLEDVPGVGKTTLARAVATVMGTTFSRIQFTSDMLPSDVLGVQFLDSSTGALEFRRGPIFSQLVLADEINRASPKTQSAMLEAMADHQVSIDDKTYPLEAPFIVLATQNPVEHHGAYPLPESQLDRFMVRLSLGYPSAADERDLLFDPRGPAKALATSAAVLDPNGVRELQEQAETVTLAESVADYLLAIVAATRKHSDIMLGVSPRGSLAFASIVRAWALLRGRDFVIPDDVKCLIQPVLAHRLTLNGTSGAGSRSAAEAILDEIAARVPVPR